MNFKDYQRNNKLAMDTMQLKPTKGIPVSIVNIMQHEYIERTAGVAKGDYKKIPEEVYIKSLKNIGVNVIDQYLALNPLSMGNQGYEGVAHGATTGAEEIICDGILIDSPEAVVEHMEKYEFPRIQESIDRFDEDKRVREILDREWELQQKLGSEILKTGYDFIIFPIMHYGDYGYANYFMAYALYPEVMEKHFSLQADYCVLNNKAAARAYKEGNLPPLFRLDHDIADSKSTLVDIKSLDRIWLPEVARSLEPVIKTDVRMIWHCDGNLMQMVPRLIDIGIKGFQGFQYEHGMDYKKICAMKTKDGEELIIWAGVSVTRTLPLGKPSDVKKEMEFLVENGPKTGLFLGASSSLTPGAPWENVEMMIEGFKYYREHGRG